jgi:hypothetical protein
VDRARADADAARRARGGGARGRIYAIGGVSAARVVGTNESYDPASDTWRSHAAMPTAREHLAAAAVGDRIHVLGGATRAGLGATAVVEAFRVP